MVTKEQCLLNKALEQVDYGRNQKLIQTIVKIYNYGKQYVSEKVFLNNEYGLDAGLRGMSPSQIIYSVLGDDAEYRIDDPFFIIEGDGIRSIDGYDFRRMLQPEDMQKLMTNDVFEELDDTDITDAFDEFVQANYPQQYRALDFDNLYDMGYRTGGQVMQADWNQLVKKLMEYKPQLDEGRVLEMTEEELRKMVAEGAQKVYEEIKIKKSHEGKLTDLKNRTGKSESEIYNDGNPAHKKMVVFARNARKWNHK